MEFGLRRLRILREVAEHGGVTAAARAMHYSPSGVSQQVAALEDDIGAPVLERHGRGVRLTQVGRVLLEHSEILLAAERDARTAVECARDTSAVEIKVGVFCTVAASMVPWIITDLAARHPQVHVSTRETDPDDASLDLRHGHLDLAFLIDYPDASEPWRAGIAITPIGLDTARLAAPAGRFDQEAVNLADLADEDWVMPGPHSYYGRAMRSACRRAGFEPRIIHQVDEQATALPMVAGGLGVTLMSRLGRPFFPADGINVLELTEPVHRQIVVGHDEAAGGRPAVSAFLDSALRAAPVAGLSPPQSKFGR